MKGDWAAESLKKSIRLIFATLSCTLPPLCFADNPPVGLSLPAIMQMAFVLSVNYSWKVRGFFLLE
jgi:hypothetical protein